VQVGRESFSRYRFLSGLSTGIVVLSVAALFWIGLAAWGLRGDSWTLALAPVLVAAVLVAIGGLRLARRFPRLRRSDLPTAELASIHRLNIWFRIISTAQTVLIVLVGVITSWLQRTDLLWPLIGLVVSLHFIPLGRLFRVRPYYVTGLLGSLVSAVAILGFSGSGKDIAAGIGLSIVMVVSSAYIVANTERLAAEATS
jgi:hypothetical protein